MPTKHATHTSPTHAPKHAKTTKTDWSALAAALPSDEFKLAVPLGVLLGEAISVARYFDAHWTDVVDPKTKASVAGLDTAGAARLPKTTGDELRELEREVRAAHAAYLVTVDPRSSSGDKLARAHFVLDEITATLEWIFDDGVTDEKDAQLANVEAAHANDPASADALALALDDFASLGELHRKDMKDVGGFDVALLVEAHKLATELRGSVSSPFATSTAAKAALSKRNRLLQLLQARIDCVRAAARFVYRQTPDYAKGALSAYQQKRRAQARRAAAKEANAPKPAPTVTSPQPAAATNGNGTTTHA